MKEVDYTVILNLHNVVVDDTGRHLVKTRDQAQPRSQQEVDGRWVKAFATGKTLMLTLLSSDLRIEPCWFVLYCWVGSLGKITGLPLTWKTWKSQGT